MNIPPSLLAAIRSAPSVNEQGEAPKCEPCDGSGIANADEPVPCVTFRPKCCNGTGHQTHGQLVVLPAERCLVCSQWDTRTGIFERQCSECTDGYLAPKPGRVVVECIVCGGEGCEDIDTDANGTYIAPAECQPRQLWIHADPAPRVCRLDEVTAEESVAAGLRQLGAPRWAVRERWAELHPDHDPDAPVAVFRAAIVDSNLPLDKSSKCQ